MKARPSSLCPREYIKTMSGLVAKAAQKAAEKEMKSQVKSLNKDLQAQAGKQSGPRIRGNFVRNTDR